MKKKTRLIALGTLSLALLALVGRAQAATTGTAYLDLQVGYNGTLSVKIDGVQYSTRSVSGGPNTLQAPASSSTVTNDATGLTEQWQLSVASTGNWTVAGATTTAPGLDAYAYQALFISSVAASACPAPGASNWDSNVSTVTGTATSYLGLRYSDPTVLNGTTGKPDVNSGAQDGNMNVLDSTTPGAGRRGLCVRLYMPGSVSTQQSQMIRLTITAASAL